MSIQIIIIKMHYNISRIIFGSVQHHLIYLIY